MSTFRVKWFLQVWIQNIICHYSKKIIIVHNIQSDLTWKMFIRSVSTIPTVWLRLKCSMLSNYTHPSIIYEVSIALRIRCGILLTIKTLKKYFVNFSETYFQIDDSKVESYISIFCNFLADALLVLTLPIHRYILA